MNVTIIAERYAKALFNLALEMKKLERVKADIDLVETVTLENPEFRRTLESPIIRGGKKIKIVSGIFENHLDELTLRFLNLVARKERTIFLGAICKSFIKLYNEYHNILIVKLISAVPIRKNLKEKLIGLFEARTHKTIHLIEEIDENMLGGFIISMEDQKFNASLKHKIIELSKVFHLNPYIREF
jgi:F-type H+-transporting ATPase subunit delta